ncbi:MAG: hypothetical protein KF802_02870 [Bdellovibrionaceae bacterium]|nr:hypothetical protein [Pseudobdellovibrionaceae bacterium]
MAKTNNTAIKLPIDQLKELIMVKFKQMIANPEIKVRPIYIEGHAGIGKTQIVQQAAKELTEELKVQLGGKPVECRTVNLQFCERPDFMGLAFVNPKNETQFASPMLLPKEGFGLYFLDEANRVESEIRSGLLTLLEDRNVNGHNMGKYWLPILAGNPSETEAGEGTYEVGEFDSALKDRVAKVVMVGDIMKTLAHLEQKYPSHFLINYLKSNVDFISFKGNGISPRTFEYAIRATLNYDKMAPDLIQRILGSELGVEASHNIMQMFNLRGTASYQQIRTGNVDAFKFIKENANRHDVITAINRGFTADVFSRHQNKQNFTVDEIKFLRIYMKMIKDEFKVSLFNGINSKDTEIWFTETFIKGTELYDFVLRVFSTKKVA